MISSDKDSRLLAGIKNADLDRVKEALSHGANPKRSPHTTAKDILDEVQKVFDENPENREKLREIRQLIESARATRAKPVILPSRAHFKAPRSN